MSDWDAPTTVGFAVNSEARTRLVREFDDVLTQLVDGRYKRGREIATAMQWRVELEAIFSQRGYGDLGPEAKRRTLEQALHDHLDAESAGE